MASPSLRTTEISLPVLQKSTSHIVSDSLPPQPISCLSEDDDNEPLPAPPPEFLLQYDYCHPDNTNIDQNVPIDTDVTIPSNGINGSVEIDIDNQQQQQQQQLQEQQQQQKVQQEKQFESTNIESDILLRKHKEEEGIEKLQSKYASPENIIPPRVSSLKDSEHNDIVNNITSNLNTRLSIRDSKDLTRDLTIHTKEGKEAGSVSAFSDASSDISDATTSAPSAASSSSNSAPPASTVPVLEGATETDIQQVDMFYRSQKTDVRVCKSLANMYLSATKTLKRNSSLQTSVNNGEIEFKSPNPEEMSMDDWDFIKTGIPVLVLNTGEHLRLRKLTIILAEKGTGFTLWEDELNTSTQYGTPHANFHTLSLSTDPSRLVGFSFDEAAAATEFADALQSLLPRQVEDSTNDKKKKKKSKEKKAPKQKYKPPRKIDISGPCCFVHVTKLEPSIMALPSPSLFPPPPSGAKLTQEILRSRSQSSELSSYSTSPSEHSCKS